MKDEGFLMHAPEALALNGIAVNYVSGRASQNRLKAACGRHDSIRNRPTAAVTRPCQTRDSLDGLEGIRYDDIQKPAAHTVPRQVDLS